MATARRRRRRGTGGIIERANGTFIARVSLGVVDGKRRRLERKGFRSRAEAEVALATLRGAANLDDRSTLLSGIGVAYELERAGWVVIPGAEVDRLQEVEDAAQAVDTAWDLFETSVPFVDGMAILRAALRKAR